MRVLLVLIVVLALGGAMMPKGTHGKKPETAAPLATATVTVEPLSAPAGSVFHFIGSGFTPGTRPSTNLKQGDAEGAVPLEVDADGNFDVGLQLDSPGPASFTVNPNEPGQVGPVDFTVE